jgi:hypothetical protein
MDWRVEIVRLAGFCPHILCMSYELLKKLLLLLLLLLLLHIMAYWLSEQGDFTSGRSNEAATEESTSQDTLWA